MPRVRKKPFEAMQRQHRMLHLSAALERLQAMNDALSTEEAPVLILKQPGEFPSYDDIAFSYRGNVFSVKLYERNAEGGSPLSDKEILSLQEYARIHRLVPCCFPIDADTHQPLGEGWNLLSLETGDPIDPAKYPPAPDAVLSEWELQFFRVRCAVEWLLKERRGEIQNICTLPGAIPQIFFTDGEGNRAWALVRDADSPEPPELDLREVLKEYPALQDCDGYLGEARIDPPTDQRGYLRTDFLKMTGSFSGLRRIYLSPGTLAITTKEEKELLDTFPPELPEEQLEEEVSGKGCLVFFIGALAALLAACSMLS